MSLRRSDISPVLEFLRCRSPALWAAQAVQDLDVLLADHASLELKAAQQAQRLIWKYAAGSEVNGPAAAVRSRLLQRMSRLAREELRHFEQVVAIIESRGGHYRAISPSRYAGALHDLARRSDPGALIDQLIIGAVIEARSCERFFTLLPQLAHNEPVLAAFYASLLRSESRHFSDYLDLARRVAGAEIAPRIEAFLERDAQLMVTTDTELRFHSGPVSPGQAVH